MCPSEHVWPASQHSVKWGRYQLRKHQQSGEATIFYNKQSYSMFKLQKYFEFLHHNMIQYNGLNL